jgi:hypothetical protein
VAPGWIIGREWWELRELLADASDLLREHTVDFGLVLQAGEHRRDPVGDGEEEVASLASGVEGYDPNLVR